MLISYMESKGSKDQIFLLLCEPHCAETLYCQLANRSFSMELKQKILKVMIVLTQLSFQLVPKEPMCHTPDGTADVNIIGQGWVNFIAEGSDEGLQHFLSIFSFS
jgi:hypothetical protein